MDTIRNLDSIKNVVSEINNRVDKINTEYVNNDDINYSKSYPIISKKKTTIYVSLVVVCLISCTYILFHFRPQFVMKKDKFMYKLDWLKILFCNLIIVLISLSFYAYLYHINHPLLLISQPN